MSLSLLQRRLNFDLHGLPITVPDLHLFLFLFLLPEWLPLLRAMPLILPLHQLLPPHQPLYQHMHLPVVHLPLQHMFQLFNLSQLRGWVPHKWNLLSHLPHQLFWQLHLRTLLALQQ